MNIAQVEEKVKTLVGNLDQAEFLFNLLDCYGKPKASITRLKIVGKGSYNLSKTQTKCYGKNRSILRPPIVSSSYPSSMR